MSTNASKRAKRALSSREISAAMLPAKRATNIDSKLSSVVDYHEAENDLSIITGALDELVNGIDSERDSSAKKKRQKKSLENIKAYTTAVQSKMKKAKASSAPIPGIGYALTRMERKPLRDATNNQLFSPLKHKASGGTINSYPNPPWFGFGRKPFLETKDLQEIADMLDSNPGSTLDKSTIGKLLADKRIENLNAQGMVLLRDSISQPCDSTKNNYGAILSLMSNTSNIRTRVTKTPTRFTAENSIRSMPN